MSAATSPHLRNAYIDYLRGWSIFGIVSVHFAGSFVNPQNAWSESFYLGLTFNQIFSFAVPLFVFLSGYLAGISRKNPTLWTYYRSRFKRIFVPYFIASVATFFLLNHWATWLALPDTHTKLTWLSWKLFYYGIEPTLYFIPLIILMYVLQPLLKALPKWLHHLIPAFSFERWVLTLSFLLLILHVTLGIKCFNGSLNYYVWGRPNPLFWMIYFFAGLHFQSLTSFMSKRMLIRTALVASFAAIGFMFWNGLQLNDRSVVGEHFEYNNIDSAYVRPLILIYNLVMTICLSTGIALGWKFQAGKISFLGRYTLEIYLWHIIILYYGAWKYAETLAACRQIPELILIICASTCFLIAGLCEGIPRAIRSLRQYRVSVTRIS